MTREGPLAGIRVLELSRDVAGAYCGRQFAVWGADVVAAEPPEGSPLRRRHPFATAPSGEAVSLLWTNVAANKRAAIVEDGAALGVLLEQADVFVTDYPPQALAGLGVSLEALHQARPDLCLVSITPFGLVGPYAGYQASELTVQALSGYLGLNGLMGLPPLQAPGHLTGYAVGVNAFVAALATYLKRERTGFADLAEVSAMETLATIIPFLRVQYMGGDKVREGGTEAGVRILPCADGWISMMVSGPFQRKVLAEVLAIPAEAFPADLYEGGYFEVVDKTMAFFSAYTSKMPVDELFLALEHRGVTCGKVMSPEELLSLEQLKVRGFFHQAHHPDLGPIRYAGTAARLANAAMAPPVAAPRLADRIAPEAVGWTPRAPRPGGDPARRNERPLEGARVLDLTQAWIGPFATLIFADLGAEVIKIESHRRPDVWRQASPQPIAITNVKAEKVNRSHYFNSVNRNKKDLTLDLTSAEGKAIFRTLVRTADVVAENYTARVMAKFGLDYPALSQVKPDLVMMSSCGFGKTGPWSDFKTNGSAIEALAGWDWLHRYPGGAPILMGFYQADAIDGLQMAALTLVSLVRKARTGQGESIDGAMLEASASYLGEIFLQTQLTGQPEAQGNRSADMAPHGVFPCRGEDRWIAIAAQDEIAWRALAAEAGLDAPQFADLAGRKAHEDQLEAALAAWTQGQDADALMQRLQAAGVAAGVVRGAAECLDEPHLSARDWFKVMTHPDLGAHKYNGFPWRFAGCELVATIPPPRLGEHSDELLRDLLSFSDSEIADLKAKNVTGVVF